MNRDRSPIKRYITNCESTKMATISYSDIQCRFNFAKCMVPEYFGGSKDLNYFLNSSKEFLDKFTFTDVDLNRYFLQYVISQVKGDARDVVTLNNPKTFEELKTLLLRKYKDPSSEENLLTNLTTSFQQYNQDFEEFALEINQKLHKLKENAQIEYSDQDSFLKLKYRDYDKQALYSFVSGLREPYCSFVRQQNPINLDNCISICREYDNIQAQINYKNFLRQNMSKKNTFKNHNTSANHQHSQNNQRPHTNFHANASPHINSFPRGPINLSTNKPYQKSFQAPQNDKNVFKPRYNTDHLPKPTPMSTTTRHTFQNNNQRSNFQRQNFNPFARQVPSHPGIVVEELHNMEEDFQKNPEQNFQIDPPPRESI